VRGGRDSANGALLKGSRSVEVDQVASGRRDGTSTVAGCSGRTREYAPLLPSSTRIHDAELSAARNGTVTTCGIIGQ
jgi:hypothetical protein